MTNVSTTSVAGIPAKIDPLVAVRSLAEHAAQQRGASFVDSGLRLFDEPVEPVEVEHSEQLISPFELGRSYELLLAPSTRRKVGAHLTPEAVARNLVAMLPVPAPKHRVLDPSVGGAAFLLAAADTLVAAGGRPDRVSKQLLGIDLDPGAVAVAEAALSLWGLDHDLAPEPLPGLRQGDGLLEELPMVDLVVGNPPFLNQLRSSSSHTTGRRAHLRDRWGDLVSAYTDDAWLFLAAGLDALTNAGSMAMVQPASILAARHGEAVRRYVHEHAHLNALWLGRDQIFDASVHVCGLVITRGSSASKSLARSVGRDFTAVEGLDSQPAPEQWGSAAAGTLGTPNVRLSSKQTLGDLATATAGFRDQFYGFVPYVSELAAGLKATSIHAPLVTVGMIDVLELRWGKADFRFAKQSYRRPVIDVEALRQGDARLADWVDARMRPKVLMATQTRVVEVWVDEPGHAIPATPVLSIEPLQDVDASDDLWMLAAALSAPVVSAHLYATKFGTALSLGAMKIAARDVLAVPLPANQVAWAQAAAVLRADATQIDEFASLMQDAYRVKTEQVTSWWRDRVPNRSVS